VIECHPGNYSGAAVEQSTEGRSGETSAGCNSCSAQESQDRDKDTHAAVQEEPAP